MEDKIEVGEYVRTEDNKIGQFVGYSSRKETSLYKSPFNCFIKIKGRKSNLQCCREYTEPLIMNSEEIKSIATKEQFEEIEYKL